MSYHYTPWQSPSPAFLQVPLSTRRSPQSFLFSRLSNPQFSQIVLVEEVLPSEHPNGLPCAHSSSSSFLCWGPGAAPGGIWLKKSRGRESPLHPAGYADILQNSAQTLIDFGFCNQALFNSCFSSNFLWLLSSPNFQTAVSWKAVHKIIFVKRRWDFTLRSTLKTLPKPVFLKQNCC